MKRFWISVTILCVTFVLALSNGFVLLRLTEQMTNRLEQAQLLAEQEQWEQASALTEDALGIWTRSEGYLYVVLRHSEADAVAQEFSEVLELLHWGEEAEYTSANARLVEDIRLLAEMEAFSLKNLL